MKRREFSGCVGRSKAGKFLSSQEGGVFILFGFSVLTLIIAIGVAIDFSRVLTARSHAASALDAALLGAASEADNYSTQAELEARAKNYFTANYNTEDGRSYLGATASAVRLDISELSEGKVSGFVTLDVPLAFGDFLGKPDISMDIGAQVERFLGKDMEISLALDNTASMCDPSCAAKFDIMKSAVDELIDMVQSAVDSTADSDAQVSMALVPFRHGIKINNVNNLKTIFGPGENAKTDTRDGDGADDPSLYSSLPIVRGLTNNLPLVKSYVNSMTLASDDAGGTYTASGIITGWKALRDQSESEFKGLSAHQNPARAPRPLNDLRQGNVIKAMIVLSDGSNTFWYVNPDLPASDPRSQREYLGKDLPVDFMKNKALSGCAKAKAEGIQIYSIAFVSATDRDPAGARDLMRQCASSPQASYYFEPKTGEELRETFRAIANSLIDKLVTK